ncbi:MAG TPA: response regulator transcription factor [Actinomycetota bacterium]|nr:response regulator transcription factor [Actinomycetota bacterium]
MGTGTVPAPLLSGLDAEPSGRRRPRLLLAGGDRSRLGDLAGDLEGLGYDCQAEVIHQDLEAGAGLSAVLVDVRAWASEAVSWCQRGRKQGWLGGSPVVSVVGTAQLAELAVQEGLFDDYVEDPYSLAGLGARLRLVRWRSQRDTPDMLRVRDLVVEPESYRAMLHGAPIELTYMEFELLRFLMANPGRVFTRENLLSRVWGYEYYGGVRTVDVHIRRLRAKLGDDHAKFIETVRGVGYRFSTG